MSLLIAPLKPLVMRSPGRTGRLARRAMQAASSLMGMAVAFYVPSLFVKALAALMAVGVITRTALVVSLPARILRPVGSDDANVESPNNLVKRGAHSQHDLARRRRCRRQGAAVRSVMSSWQWPTSIIEPESWARVRRAVAWATSERGIRKGWLPQVVAVLVGPSCVIYGSLTGDHGTADRGIVLTWLVLLVLIELGHAQVTKGEALQFLRIPPSASPRPRWLTWRWFGFVLWAGFGTSRRLWEFSHIGDFHAANVVDAVSVVIAAILSVWSVRGTALALDYRERFLAVASAGRLLAAARNSANT